MLHPADKAVLRLTLGLGLATLIAYGLALPIPYLVCLMAVLVLVKPGPALSLVKGLVLALIVAGLVAVGVLMVPLLEYYPASGVVLTGIALYALFYLGQRTGHPLTQVLVISFTLAPVAGVVEQGLVTLIAVTLAAGVAVGALVSGLSQALFPDPPAQGKRPAPPSPSPETAAWIALRGMLVVMPVFILALTDPSFYLPAIMNTVSLGQQACSADTRSAGRQLLGSTLMAAALATLVWFALSLLPSLWMLVLWLMLAALWVGARIYRVRATAFPPLFWSSALTTLLILLGPAIEDSASGEGVLGEAASRTLLYLGVAAYAWATVWILEYWRASRSEALAFQRNRSGGVA